MKNILIVGSGFNGFCNAMQLAKKKYNVTIIDKAPFFGGIMYSQKIFDFYVDNGVHVFDGIPIRLAQIVKKILKNKVENVDFISQSAFNNKVSKGFSLPDLSSVNLSTKKKIKKELLIIEKKNQKKKIINRYLNLKDFFKKRYGATAANIFSSIFKKIYNIDPIRVEPQAISQTSLARLKFLSDKEMIKLKQHKFLNTVLAARRKLLGKVDDLVSIYPIEGKAMRAWCDSSKKYLEKIGVKILLKQDIYTIKQLSNKIYIKTQNLNKKFDKILWCNDNLNAISNLIKNSKFQNFNHSVPVVFYIFITKKNNIKNFTYLQNFDLHSLSYRIAAGGLYSNQKDKNNNTFITVECPTKINSKIWKNPEKRIIKLWNECKKLKLVKQNSKLTKYDFKRIPVTLKMPLKGYTENRKKIFKIVNKKFKSLYFDQSTNFFRREIFLNSLNVEKRLNLKK